MRIANVETALYRIQRQPGLSNSTQQIEATSLLTAHVRTDEGLEGVGWTYSHGTSGRGMKEAIDTLLAPRIMGEDPAYVERLYDRMWKSVFPNITMSGLTTVALAPLDIALWDLAGKATGKPLFRLLGGYRDSVPAYGSGLDLAYSTEDLLDQVTNFVDQKYWGVKIKIGRENLGEDLERLRAVRKAIGPYTPLMVDANQRWSVGEAVTRARAMEEFNLFWLEEPILAEDHGGYERLSNTVNVALATGEGEWMPEGFLDLFQRGAVQFVQADVCRVGGVTPWMRIARVADAYHLPMAPHLVEEISMHLCCGASNGHLVEHLPTLNLNNTGYILNPVLPRDGKFNPTEDPGHGVLFDWAALEGVRIR